MTSLFTKGGRMLGVAALLALTVAAGGAFAQKRLSPGSNIGVGKCKLGAEDCYATFNEIQKAVNAASSGDVIEILDDGVYKEQVTIDGRANAPWKNVVGGKNGITIRYIPSSGSTSRPTIQYRDTENISPKNCQEAKKPGDTLGSSGNFETNGALRIIRASGVVIEGLIIDGGGGYVWGANGVWDNSSNCSNQGGCDGKACPLYHGNAAVAIAVSGNVQIRDCQLQNAHFGIAVKDRNTGGVFGNPNPADNDYTVPLSGFGKTGNHLFEYNKVGENDIGIFFESSWDLGSTVRYNLIYGNYARSSGMSGAAGSDADKATGAIGFKDSFLSPIAIYNNTFYDNNMNFIGFWQVGFQHLIFNNIFSKPHAYGQAGVISYMCVDHMFPQRMKHCLLSADGAKPDGPPYYSVQFNKFTQPQQGNGGNGIQPGVVITGSQDGGAFAANANNKWLETAGLFKNTTTPSRADFLEPDWTNPLVTNFIRNQGWADAGIVNEDGKVADLGAIPYSGKRPCSSPLDQKSRIRLSPNSVVTVSGTSATATFYIRQEVGSITDLKVKYIRWIAPVPNNKDSFGSDKEKSKVVPSTSVATPTGVGAVTAGNNRVSFTLPRALGNGDEYGFFEIVFEGKGPDGTTVISSDVGFLPYRKLEYTFDIKVVDNTGKVTTSVVAGDKYTLRVSVLKGTAPFTQQISEVEYNLLSDPTAFMYLNQEGTNPLISDTKVTFNPNKEYSVYFTRADPNETISASGVYVDAQTNRLPILGTLDIVVHPGLPERVEFKDPISLTKLGDGTPDQISRGGDRPVLVEVQDRYGNAVDVAVPVTIVSNKPEFGDVVVKTVTNDKATGIATFTARATNAGKTGDVFDLTATIENGKYKDKDNIGRLRLGRALDQLQVFYSDTTAAGYDPDAKIEGNVGEWFKVTVRVIVADTVNTLQTSPKVVRIVDPEAGLKFSATSGGDPATEFTLNRGVATFWVSSDKEVSGACINVDVLDGAGGSVVGSISAGNRCDISFIKPSGSIVRAVVYGDGHGRPDSLLITYSSESGGLFTGANPMPKPDKVVLTWPTADGVAMEVPVAGISVRDSLLLHVNLANATLSGGSAQRPAGYTSVAAPGRGLVTVFGGSDGPDAVDDGFELLDGIGPVLAKNGEAGGVNPQIIENPRPETEPDTLIVMVSEQIRNVDMLKGKSLIWTTGTIDNTTPPSEPAAGGADLEVLDAVFEGGTTYRVAVAAGTVREGDWIRLKFDGDNTVKDRAAQPGVIEDNKPHAQNRWVQLMNKQVQPVAKDLWYTSDPFTGKVDKVFAVFNKTVDLSTWFSGAGGFVNFGDGNVATGVDGAGAGLTAKGDTLIIDLSVAFKSSQAKIRTSGPMVFTLGYGAGAPWGEGKATSDRLNPRDAAAPVLADTVRLKMVGGNKEDPDAVPDTLFVVYSERPSDDALKVATPVTIWNSGSAGKCEPELERTGEPVSVGSNYYRVTYVVKTYDLEAKCPGFSSPKTGDLVNILVGAGVKDADGNAQDTLNNIKQPLKVEREIKWSVKVKKNPFMSDASGSSVTRVVISPNAAGAKEVEIDATIFLFDNLGALVALDTLKSAKDSIDWQWNGTNRKGRLVGTGTYLLKAVCRAKIQNDGGVPEIKPAPPFVRSLGVVRGKM